MFIYKNKIKEQNRSLIKESSDLQEYKSEFRLDEEDNVLYIIGTRGNAYVSIFYQTPNDVRRNNYNVRSSSGGGGKSMEELPSEIANFIAGSYYYDGVKNIKYHYGLPMFSDLSYIGGESFKDVPYFVSKSDPRYRVAKHLGKQEISPKNIINLIESIWKGV